MSVFRRIANRLRQTRIARFFWSEHCLIVHRLDCSRREQLQRSPEVKRDSPADLACYVAEESWLPKARFEAMCRERLAAGEHVYTMCVDGRLAAFTWLVPNQRTAKLSSVGQQIEFPPQSCTSYGSYALPSFRGRGIYKKVLSSALCDAFDSLGAKAVFAAVDENNDASTHMKQVYGYVPARRLVLRRRFGATHRENIDLLTAGSRPGAGG